MQRCKKVYTIGYRGNHPTRQRHIHTICIADLEIHAQVSLLRLWVTFLLKVVNIVDLCQAFRIQKEMLTCHLSIIRARPLSVK